MLLTASEDIALRIKLAAIAILVTAVVGAVTSTD